MPFTVITNRRKEYVYDKNDIKFTLTLEMPLKENRNLGRLAQLGKDNELGEANDSSLKYMLISVRECLVAWSDDIVDPEGNVIPFSEDNQKVVFDAVTDLEDVLTDLIKLWVGPTEKN